MRSFTMDGWMDRWMRAYVRGGEDRGLLSEGWNWWVCFCVIL